jgi:phosphatidylinositol alpha-mannosyltransferase
VTKNHLGNVVHFMGYISEAEKPNYLASADIAVFPSLSGESFGIVLIEAMAAGSETIIAGNNSGYRSVMMGRSRQLINPYDTNAFAKLLRHYIRNAPERLQAYKWQQSQINRYDVRQVGKTIVDHYIAAVQNAQKS